MNKIIVMSGASGSGKSYYANKFINDNKSLKSIIVSADHFFCDGNKYNFDHNKLDQAHGQCFRDFINACMNKKNLIIVDNTNTTNEEIAPYMTAANAFNYSAQIITIDCPTEIAAKRNSHNVPLINVMAQNRRISERKLLPWWKNITIKSE